MSDQTRPTSRWSTSMSVATKSTSHTNQTIPLASVRKKLFRHSGNNQKTFTQRMAKSKHDMEELFKLYYSNDIKFDTFHRQIVTGTRIPTARTSSLTQNNLTSSSTNIFNSKHCVSQEQMNNTDVNDVCLTSKGTETTTTMPKSVPIRRTRPIRTENTVPTYSPSLPYRSPITVTPVISNQPITSPSTQHNELCDTSIVKSVTFLEEISSDIHEHTNKPNNSPRSKSSILSIPSVPPSLLPVNNNNNNQKDTATPSQTPFSMMTSMQPQKPLPAVVTGSAVIVRPRTTPGKLLRGRQRPTSKATTISNSSLPQFTRKSRLEYHREKTMFDLGKLDNLHQDSPSSGNPSSIQPDASEFPAYTGAQRTVSIPSRCSRYVLVTFPEVPLRYNAPSYVERLLLPERFPNLFQNIIQSYDHINPHHQNTK